MVQEKNVSKEVKIIGILLILSGLIGFVYGFFVWQSGAQISQSVPGNDLIFLNPVCVILLFLLPALAVIFGLLLFKGVEKAKNPAMAIAAITVISPVFVFLPLDFAICLLQNIASILICLVILLVFLSKDKNIPVGVRISGALLLCSGLLAVFMAYLLYYSAVFIQQQITSISEELGAGTVIEAEIPWLFIVLYLVLAVILIVIGFLLFKGVKKARVPALIASALVFVIGILFLVYAVFSFELIFVLASITPWLILNFESESREYFKN